MAGRHSRIDDPNRKTTLRVTNNEHADCRRVADGELSVLDFRMVGVGERGGQRVPEYRPCLVEGYAVFACVLLRLLRVPSEEELQAP